MKIKILVLILFLAGPQAFAKKQYILLGGGGEPINARDIYGSSITGTIFDGNLKKVRLFLDKSPDWKKEVSFNGGHPDTEAILASRYADSSPSNFTDSKFEEIIKKYEDQLNAGDFSSGDQILIHIDSHGAIKSGNQETHSIATARSPLQNYDSLGEKSVNLDQLKRITTLAKQKGVKVGIIDNSCHSGSTLGLADDNTCVLASSGPNHYSYTGNGTASKNILAKLAPGKNLEEIFLAARGESSDSDFPMISSPEGKMVQDKLYNLLTPYLYYFGKNRDKLTPFMANAEENSVCKYDQGFEQINQIINNLEDIQVVTKRFLFFKWNGTTKKVDLSGIRNALSKYYAFQTDIIKEVKDLDVELNNSLEKFTATEGEFPSETSYTWKELISTDFDKIIHNYSVRLAETATEAVPDEEKRRLRLNLQLYRKAQQRAQEITAQHPEFKTLKKQLASVKDKEARSFRLAESVGRESRVLYNALYKDIIKAGSTTGQANPCRDFIL